MKLAVISLALSMALGAPTIEAASMIQPTEWSSYVQSFVGEDGRVIDTGNNNISHSESQGYGLILSVLADDQPTFERILSFTTTQLLVRDDGLAGWRWDPAATPNLTDSNNATDGDILIAYGLALAGDAWSDSRYTDHARQMARTIGRTMIVDVDGMPAILPGAVGFDAEPDGRGPILNPSYWVFEALPVFAKLEPSINWDAISATGVELVRRAETTRGGVPPDWLVLDDEGQIQPAPELPVEFGYNGIRIPLYMMRAALSPDLLQPFQDKADDKGLYKINPLTGNKMEPIVEPGYRLIKAGMDCVQSGTVIPDDLTTMSPTSYYSATLQLLMLEYLRRARPICILSGVP
jgi:endo-1,4-beta-D-glucanase Y